MSNCFLTTESANSVMSVERFLFSFMVINDKSWCIIFHSTVIACIKTIIIHIVRLMIIIIHGILHDACSHKCWLISLKRSQQKHSASDSSDNALMTLAAFHGHIDFSPTLQIIAGCCESYPPRAAGRSFCSVLTWDWLSDLRNVISWDLIDCNWLMCTSCLWYE